MLQELSTFNIIIIGLSLVIFLVSMVILFYFRYSRKMVLSELNSSRQKIAHQKELLKHEVETIEKERIRIARDLHDEVGAMLSYTSMNISRVLEDDQSVSEIKNIIKKNKKTLDDALQEVRRISHDLLPPILDMIGLQAAIEDFIEKQSGKLKFNTTFIGDFSHLDKSHSLQIYRVLLEFINNSVKYSNGDLISLQINYKDEILVINISDNGDGFKLEETGKGLGLSNMENRLEAINAEHNFLTEINKGTSLYIKLKT